MDIELKEICDFISKVTPLDRLPQSTLEQLTQEIRIRYLRRGTTVSAETESSRLMIIRKGAISLSSKSGRLIGKAAEGDLLTLLMTEPDTKEHSGEVTEDMLVYSLDTNALKDIATEPDSNQTVLDMVIKHIRGGLSQNLIKANTNSSTGSALIYNEIETIYSSPAITIASGSSILEASIKMSEHDVSSIMVTDTNGAAIGILTDTDIRRDCVATGMSTDAIADSIMTHSVRSIKPSSNAFDALMLMTRKGIHHLPVVDNNQLLGMITSTDLIKFESKNTVYLSTSIARAKDIATLAQESKVIPQLQVQLTDMDASADHIGKAVSAVNGAITRRLIELAEEKLGPPPVPYSWVAAGSQARREQTSHTDQDNALIISNDLDPKDIDWYTQLGTFVCDGLAECGFIHCPGNIMAMNPEYRQTQATWDKYFENWIDTPDPQALLNASTFFDFRTIHGEDYLLDEIRDRMLERSQKNTLFLGLLAKNALGLRPPLGFFRGFVLIEDGEHKDTLDLKLNGTAPIVDLARIYALAEGIKTVNTRERILQAAGTNSLSEDGAADLLAAFEFIGEQKIQHQTRQIKRNEKADNFLPPKDIPQLEREYLKDAFKVIQTMQNSIKMKY
ncbi:DUF294 nucleotidyltransferase-like domain-containing protein [Leucothrix pacifica]|uniref:CBS domain-containing protein n=1 Tax=Leucothrix pacifica TaxID=1247513 RepID=A0A317C7V7_9GAMM|nr:DUF294 nucleotidyltransferase-like domain-containing protein [Leucothrix pacifica]PWQ94351.1 hypothetical protein DKW60_17095 [Leucothrix pacifica]